MTPTTARPHLLLVAPSAYPLGGIATWLDGLVPGLERCGWRVTVGLTAGRHHDAAAYLERHPFPDRVEIAAPSGTAEGRARALATALRRVAPTLALSVNIPDLVVAAARCRERVLPDLRAGVTLHALQPDQILDLRRFGAALDGVVVTNRLLARLAANLGGVGEKRTHYAPYGVPLQPGIERPRRIGAPLRIGYSGRIESFQKRAGDLAAILDELEGTGIDAELRVAGSGPEEPELRRLLAARIERGSARLLGALAPGELEEQLYRWCDALVVPSFWETGPIVAWEAMAAGLPVIAAAYVGSGLEGSLRDGENCLLYPVGDAARAAGCLVRLRDPELAARLAAGGRRLVAERYTIEKSIAAWDAALRAILASRPARAVVPRPAPAGRLDRWLGAGPAEMLRRFAGREYEHAEPGGEWPHTHTSVAFDDENFWRLAREEDARASGAPA